MKRSRMALLMFLCSFGAALHVVGFIDADRSEAADLTMETRTATCAPGPVAPAYTDNGLCVEPGFPQLRLTAKEAAVSVARLPQVCPNPAARGIQVDRETTPTFLNPGFGISVHDDLLSLFESLYSSTETDALTAVPPGKTANLATLADDSRHSVGQDDVLSINASNDGLAQASKTGAVLEAASHSDGELEWDGYTDDTYDDCYELDYDYCCEARDDYDYCCEDRLDYDYCCEDAAVEGANVFATGEDQLEYVATVPGDGHWTRVVELSPVAAEPLYAEEVVREDLAVEEDSQPTVEVRIITPAAQSGGVRTWLVAGAWVMQELGNWMQGVSEGLEQLAAEVPEAAEPASQRTQPQGSPLPVGFRPLPESYLGL